MGRDISNDRGRKAVSLLASTFVLAGGLVFCLFIFVALGEKPSLTMVRWGGYYLVIMLVLWLLRDKPPHEAVHQNHFWLLGRSRRASGSHYRPELRQVPRIVRYGTNQPPTAESIRSLKDDMSNWVPGRKSDGVNARDPRIDG